MKLLLLALSATVLTTGCSQPKNRLTDDKNVEFQKKLAKAKQNNGPSQVLVVDVPKEEGDQGRTIQIPIETNLETEKITVLEKGADRTDLTEDIEIESKKELPNTEESRKKAQEEIAKAIPKEETPKEQKQAQDQKQNEVPEEKKETNGVYKITLAEARAVLGQISTLVSNKEEAIEIIKSSNTPNSGLSFEKIGFLLNGSESGFTVGITHDDKDLAVFEKVAPEFGKPVKMSNREIDLFSVCANAECDVMLFTFRKIKDSQTVFNLPLFIKIVDKQLVQAKLKTDEEYQKEAQLEAQAAKEEKSEESQNSKPLSLNELNSIREQITRTRLVGTDEELARILTAYLSPELKMDLNKLGIAIGMKEGKLNFRIGHDSQVLTEIMNVDLKFGTAFKAETAEKYNFSAICSNENCDIIFIAFTKIENNKMVFNMPVLFRKSKDQVTLVGIKSQAEYEAEAREILKSENKK